MLRCVLRGWWNYPYGRRRSFRVSGPGHRIVYINDGLLPGSLCRMGEKTMSNYVVLFRHPSGQVGFICNPDEPEYMAMRRIYCKVSLGR